jgi:shikimate dehydrogenase
VIDNTDVEGFGRALERLLPGGARDLDVLLLGAGGGARAAALALLDGGAGRVLVRNRTPERARALVAALGDARLEVAPPDAPGGALRGGLVVNATRLGLEPGDQLPLSLSELVASGARAVVDLVYGSDPGGTPWVRAARAHGLAASDGRDMLLHQGARAFEHWWRQAAPIEAMRAALAEAPVG